MTNRTNIGRPRKTPCLAAYVHRAFEIYTAIGKQFFTKPGSWGSGRADPSKITMFLSTHTHVVPVSLQCGSLSFTTLTLT
jgi:hypothetical protein